VDAVGGFATWLLAFVAGAVVVRLLVVGAADVLAAPALRRRNYRDHELATAGGILIVLALVPIEAVRAVLEVLDLGREGASGARALVLLCCLGFGLLGFVDDLLGTSADQGFRGHLRALGERRITTGMLKLAGGGALAFLLVAAARPEAGWRLVPDALLVALAANLVNLLDRAPGRAIKGTWNSTNAKSTASAVPSRIGRASASDWATDASARSRATRSISKDASRARAAPAGQASRMAGMTAPLPPPTSITVSEGSRSMTATTACAAGRITELHRFT
jgi:hypothetical protein